MIKHLRSSFITTERPFQEGTVEVFEQCVYVQNTVRASLTITALGLYEVELNGSKIGEALFTPGYTYYPLELQVQSYDVTELLRKENVLRVYLAQGWYCGRFTYENKVQMKAVRIL